jgi:hypothetical protein
MSRLDWLALSFLCFFGGQLFGQTYCSLIVQVQTTALGVDTTAVETTVAVEEEDGTRTEVETLRGQARFCGLGLGPVTITVRYRSCSEIILKHVRPRWNAARQISIVYDLSDCVQPSLPVVAACGPLLRFVRPNRSPVRGVSFKLTSPYPQTYLGDDYGRVFLRVLTAFGSPLSGVASAHGYTTEEVRTTCFGGQRNEKVVTLRPVSQ